MQPGSFEICIRVNYHPLDISYRLMHESTDAGRKILENYGIASSIARRRLEGTHLVTPDMQVTRDGATGLDVINLEIMINEHNLQALHELERNLQRRMQHTYNPVKAREIGGVRTYDFYGSGGRLQLCRYIGFGQLRLLAASSQDNPT